MADVHTRTPDFTVKSTERYLNVEVQVKYRSSFMGVGWRNIDQNGDERINLKLNAFPVNGELVLWKYQPFNIDNDKPRGIGHKKS